MTAHTQPNLTMTLIAAVPPMIVEGMTSNDMVVREGQNVSLMCKARGYPEPYVMWRREDGEEMLIGGEHGTHILHCTAAHTPTIAAHCDSAFLLIVLFTSITCNNKSFHSVQSTSSMANCCTSPKWVDCTWPRICAWPPTEFRRRLASGSTCEFNVSIDGGQKENSVVKKHFLEYFKLLKLCMYLFTYWFTVGQLTIVHRVFE